MNNPKKTPRSLEIFAMLAMSAAMGGGFIPPADEGINKEPREKTDFDRMRLEKARLKRERRKK